MEQKQRLIVAFVGLIGILIGSMALVWVLLPQPSASPILPAAPTSPPEVHLHKKAGGLVLRWNNLPPGTQYVTIYRSKYGEEKWEKWKTLLIDPNSLGNGTLDIPKTGDLTGYIFYAAAVRVVGGNGSSTNGGGSGGTEIILWNSTSTPIEPPLPDPVITPPGGTGGASSSTSAPSPTPASPGDTAPPPGSTPPPATPPTTPPPQPAPTGVYYTPTGEISGTSAVQHGNFWVEHVNRAIEIGWQNLASDTETVVILRATGQNGPWSDLLRQTDPQATYSIRLIDNSIDAPHWYRMQAVSDTAVESFGPIYLQALE